MEAYQRLKDLGLTLPSTPNPGGNYIPAKMRGDMLYLAGQGPSRPDGTWYTGKVGRDVTWEDAYEHARLVGLQLLGVVAHTVGDLNRVEVIKVLGMVNAVPDFTDHPKVINGCSDIFCDSRRQGPACPFRGRHGLAAERYDGRGRSHHESAPQA